MDMQDVINIGLNAALNLLDEIGADSLVFYSEDRGPEVGIFAQGDKAKALKQFSEDWDKEKGATVAYSEAGSDEWEVEAA